MLQQHGAKAFRHADLTSMPKPFGTRRPRVRAAVTPVKPPLVACAALRGGSTPAPAEPTTASIPPPPSPGAAHAPTRRSALQLLSAAAAAALLAPAAATPLARAKAPADPGDWSSPGLGAPVDPNAPKFVKLPSGVKYQELNVGSGPQAGPGDTVLFDFVLRRSNGYFIYSTVEGVSFQPRDVPVGPINAKLGAGELIMGLEEVFTGMTPGSKRRVLVPPELGYVGGGEVPQLPTFATQRQLQTHRTEPLLFEVQLLRVGGRK